MLYPTTRASSSLRIAVEQVRPRWAFKPCLLLIFFADFFDPHMFSILQPCLGSSFLPTARKCYSVTKERAVALANWQGGIWYQLKRFW